MDSELLCKVVQRIERMAGIEAFLVLAVAALHLTVVPRRIWTNELMPNIKFGSRPLKQCRQIAFTVGKTVGELEAIVRLDTLHLDPAARIPRGQSAQEICRRIGGLLRIGGEEAQARELVDGVYWNSRSSGSAMHLRGTTFTSTCTRSPGRVICS